MTLMYGVILTPVSTRVSQSLLIDLFCLRIECDRKITSHHKSQNDMEVFFFFNLYASAFVLTNRCRRRIQTSRAFLLNFFFFIVNIF